MQGSVTLREARGDRWRRCAPWGPSLPSGQRGAHHERDPHLHSGGARGWVGRGRGGRGRRQGGWGGQGRGQGRGRGTKGCGVGSLGLRL